MNKKFKFIPHTADIKFQAFGKSIEEVFENSVYALISGMLNEKRKKAKKEIVKKIRVSGNDAESLLYNFLEEFIYLFDSENFLVSEVKKIKIEKNKLVAEVSGEEISDKKVTNQVKAITYNEMFIKEESGNWIAQVVLDV
ncbi:archease [Candidatus Pacearchaeota archaeon]|nr:archease [Candidatus Pacearchaeota archaeon]